MRLSTARLTWERWQAAAGPWKGWSVCPALLAPGTRDITPHRALRPAAERIAGGLASTLQDPSGRVGGGPGSAGTALILDLEPVLGVHVAARLSQLRLANAVLLLPRWPYRHAILPVDDLLYGLVSQAARLIDLDLPNVAFVLDNERSRAIPHRPQDDVRADNRYRLTLADLPNLAALRARGIGRVIKLSAPRRAG